MTVTNVGIFVGTRADLGPLSPVIEQVAEAEDLKLTLLTGVAYSREQLAQALPRSRSADHWLGSVVALAPPVAKLDHDEITRQGAALTKGTAEALRHNDIDVLVVLGDRWELLSVAPAAFLAGVPIVHLHGGEVTEGALDERVRHAVTKLADQHCVASPDAAVRVAQMGEDASRIHLTGAPGLDRMVGTAPLTESALESLLGQPVQRPLAMFTYHPPTATPGDPVGEWATAALAGTRDRCGTVLATYPGMDEGREQILTALHDAAAADPRIVLKAALGRDYPGALASVDVVVGNSSSGVIEAASVGVPAVDIGSRQQGRLRADSVGWAAEGRESVAEAVARAISPQSRELARRVVNPYGDGHAAPRIVEVIRHAPRVSRVKTFVDLEGTRA